MTEWLVVAAVLLAVIIEILVISGQVSKVLEIPNAYWEKVAKSEKPLYDCIVDEPINPSDKYSMPIPVPNFFSPCDGSSVRLPRITSVHINSDGFRDRDFSTDKPYGTFRIVMLGDSFTYGLDVNLNETFAKVLESKLNADKATTTRYEVLDMGVAGYDTRDELAFFKYKGLKYNPDMVIVQFTGGGNDMYLNPAEILKVASTLEGSLIDRWQKSSIIVQKRYASVPFDIGWKNISEPLNELKSILKNKPVIVLTLYSTDQEISALENLTASNNWILVDGNDIFANYKDYTLHPLDWHFNPTGHKLIADVLEKYVE